MTYKNKELRNKKRSEKCKLYREVQSLYFNSDTWEEFKVKLAASGLDQHWLEWRYRLRYIREDMPRPVFLAIAYLLTFGFTTSAVYAILWLCTSPLSLYIFFGVISIAANAFLSYCLPLWIIDSADA